MAVQTDLIFNTDLDKGVALTLLKPLLFTGDDDSHRFIVAVNHDGVAESLDGATVYGYFIRPDEATITMEGSVDAEGRAVLLLQENCYNIPGRFQLVIRAVVGDVKTTIFCADGYMRRTVSDSIVDDENVIPSLEDLLAQVAIIEEAVANAEDATQQALEAADKANNAQGPVGATPNLTIGTVTTLSAGSQATATITGTAENPVLNLGIPKGVDGDGADGTVQSVNGQTGAVQLTASDVGAVQSVNGKTDIVQLVADDVDALNLEYITDDAHLIPSGADMNDYTTPGVYRCATASIAGSLSNITSYTSSGFRLIVTATSSTSGCMQLVIFNTVTAPRIYWRVQSNDLAWGAWYRQASVEYGSTAYTAGETELASGAIYLQYE